MIDPNKFQADVGDLVHKYNRLVKENANLEDENKVFFVTIEDLRKKLSFSEAIIKETLKIKQALFDEVQGLMVINERMAHENLKASAPSSELQKENWKLHNEAIMLKDRINNLEREKKCMIENFNAKLREDNSVHENDIKNLNNTIIRLRSDDGNHVVQSLRKGIERLKEKIAKLQSEEADSWQAIANLTQNNRALESSIAVRDREIARLKPFEGSYDRWQLENRVLQEKLENIKKNLNGFAGKI